METVLEIYQTPKHNAVILNKTVQNSAKHCNKISDQHIQKYLERFSCSWKEVESFAQPGGMVRDLFEGTAGTFEGISYLFIHLQSTSITRRKHK